MVHRISASRLCARPQNAKISFANFWFIASQSIIAAGRHCSFAARQVGDCPIQTIANMPGISLAETIGSLNVNDEWGPEVTTSTTLEGVPYAPYSKSDKLGRMADWTQEGKEGRDRGGRQYGRNFRGR
jgi:hypothetical protein